MPETPRYTGTVVVRIDTRAYNRRVLDERWNGFIRALQKEFGVGSFEILVQPEWEERLDIIEGPWDQVDHGGTVKGKGEGVSLNDGKGKL